MVEYQKRLLKLLETLPAHSSFRESMVFHLKRQLISDFALRFNFKKVMFGTNSQKVA